MNKLIAGPAKWFLNVIPQCAVGDLLFALIRFVKIHKRIPSKRMIFNDVLFNLKTSHNIDDPLRCFVSDKEFVKLYVKAIVGDKYNVPTLDVIRTPSQLDNYEFPQDCCIKPTHASGEVIIRKNFSVVDLPKIKSWFSLNYYSKTRERNYKNLQPKVIVEPLIFGETDLTDYRFFCFNGKVKLITLDIGKYSSYQRAFFTPNWEKQDFSLHYPRYEGNVRRPDNLAEMISVAEKLSVLFDFVRVDIYSDGKDCCVGEITNCHASGNQAFIPREAEIMASNIIFSQALSIDSP